MEQNWVLLRLSQEMLRDLRALSDAENITPGQFIRNQVAMRAAAAPLPHRIPRVETGESSVNALRELVEDILFTANDWNALQSCLVEEGFALRAEGYALWLHAWPDDTPISKTNDFGLSYADLVRRLGPGEPPEPELLPKQVPVHAPLRAVG